MPAPQALPSQSIGCPPKSVARAVTTCAAARVQALMFTGSVSASLAPHDGASMRKKRRSGMCGTRRDQLDESTNMLCQATTGLPSPTMCTARSPRSVWIIVVSHGVLVMDVPPPDIFDLH